jgi:hypothetical protein
MDNKGVREMSTGTKQLMNAMGKRYENKTPEQLARELIDMGMISLYEFLLIVRDGFEFDLT